MGFSITDMLNKDTSMAAAPVKDHTIERISYSKLVPSEDNFYSMQEIEELKTACRPRAEQPRCYSVGRWQI
jgi:hypothetical protein